MADTKATICEFIVKIFTFKKFCKWNKPFFCFQDFGFFFILWEARNGA